MQIAWRSNFNSVMLHIRRCSLLSQLKACAFAISQSNSYLPVHWLFKFCSCVITSRSNENHSAVSYHYQDTLRQKSTLFECQRIWQKSTNWNLELTLRTPFLHLLQWMTLLLYVVIWAMRRSSHFQGKLKQYLHFSVILRPSTSCLKAG